MFTSLLATLAPAVAASDDRVPNLDALALAPTVGWLMLLGFALVVALCILHRETWRRMFLRAEDPRSMGVFRIVFGLVTMANINGLWELFTYLFTDEGLFLTDVARQVFAKEQYEGFGDGFGGDPYGFFGWAGFVEWIKGPKFSLLFHWDSPTAFWAHLVVFWAACTCFIVGFKTKYTKWATFILFNSIILRNQVFWEGTENVYRCFLFYLCVSRCGEAYSVDNWLRCRRLRREGRLSEPGLPGDGAGAPPSPAHPRGLEAVYRRIPAWPRMLALLNVAALYCTTGTVKNGAVWAKGDAFYYALNLDHFYRFEPQRLSAIFGTNLFRFNTWVTHWWEALFPLVVVGLISRFMRREQLQLAPAQRWASRLCWVALGLVALAIVQVTLPVHIPRLAMAPAWTLRDWQLYFPIMWLGGMAALALFIFVVRRRPPTLTVRGRRFVLDLDWFCTWLLGRRVWLGLGVIFHAHLIVMMNIGWFTPATLCTYFVFLNGSEIAHILRQIGQGLARVGVPVPADVRRGDPPLPPEDPTLPHLHRDAAAMPAWALLLGLGVAVGGVYLAVPKQVVDESGAAVTRPGIHWGAIGVGVLVGLAVVGYVVATRRGADPLTKIDPRTGRARPPWAYGSMGRFLASALCTYQITGVAIWLLPDKDCLGGEGSDSWRLRAQDPFKWWIRITQTSQGWKMFAPNPPRTNLMMQVLVTDGDGEVYDLNTDVYHPDNKPIPWIFYTRIRKINRRVVGAEGGKGQWYQKWHGRYICRKWALDHGGAAPKQVDLVKVSYPIPTPEEVAKNGPYVPEERLKRHRSSRHVHTTKCDDVNAQLPNYIRERHGLPPLPEDQPFKPWNKQRKAAWDKRVAGLAKRGRDPNRFPFAPLTIGLVVVVAGLRWRRLDRDHKAAAVAGETTPT
jgi:hypothetical protein